MFLLIVSNDVIVISASLQLIYIRISLSILIILLLFLNINNILTNYYNEPKYYRRPNKYNYE